MDMENQLIENCDVGDGTEIAEFVSLQDCNIGENCQIWRFVNMYGCEVGDKCMIGSLVEIQGDTVIGQRTRVQSHAFICSDVTIKTDVFVSHGVKFINDRYPPSGNPDEWEETLIREGASLGTGAVIMPVEIGENALVGAGSVVVEDVPSNAIVAGNPAEIIGYRDQDSI